MAFPAPKKPARNASSLDRPWEAGDSIPAPEAIHGDGDSAWALWNEVSQQHERRFADTAPMTLPPGMRPDETGWAVTQPSGGAPLAPARKPAESQPLFTLEAAMLIARRNNRVCPRPERWDAFTRMLPARKTARGTLPPPMPATGPAWAVTPPLSKRLCFREQIEWAESAGLLESVMAFMQAMSEQDWLHMGEE